MNGSFFYHDFIYNREDRFSHEDGASTSGKVITIVNQKGGCAKTTTAINLSSCLAKVGFKVLLIDLDPQSQASLGLGIEVNDEQKSIYDVFVKGTDLEQVIQETQVTRLDVAPASSILSGAQLDIAGFLGRETILKTALARLNLRQKYDYIILDCSPTLNLITINALSCAHFVLVPIQAQYLALQGMKELFYTIEMTRDRLNPDLHVLGIVVTLFDKRNKINHQILSQIKDYFKELVFKQVIHVNVRLSEAPIYKESILTYAPHSKGAVDYWELTREIVDRIGEQSATALCAANNLRYGYASR